MLLATVSLAGAGSARADVHAAGTDSWYRIENAASHLYLSALDRNGALRAQQPNRTGGQDFRLLPGSHGYQLESRLYPGSCVTAADSERDVRLEDCRLDDTAQLWNYHLSSDGSTIANVRLPYVCITGESRHDTAVLRLCDGSAGQRWYAVT